MVKPPKTMQPEAVDLSKAGRKSGSSFKEDSFHNYMARKIDMQRQQFGVVLPPPPLPSPPPPLPPPQQQNNDSAQETIASRTTSTTKPPILRPNGSKPKTILRRKNPAMKPSSLSSVPSFTSPTTPRNVVRFSPSTKRGEADEERRTRKRKAIEQAKREQSSRNHGGSSNMGSILERLQQRHGTGTSRLNHRKKKKRKLVPPGTGVPTSLSVADRNHNSSASPSVAISSIVETVDSQSQIVDGCSSLTLEKEQVGVPKASSVGDHTSHQECSMETRRSPQHELLPSTATSTSSLSSLRRARPDLFFMGIVIKVNGYTDPDNETLKRLIQKHGGDFETYETSRVTHLIADQLSKAKSEMYKKQRSPRPVCLPSWIVDSVREGRLLPHAPYIFKDMQHDQRQAGISTFFARKEEENPDSHQQSPQKPVIYDEVEKKNGNEEELQPMMEDSSIPRAEKEEEPSSEAYITESDESIVGRSNVIKDETDQGTETQWGQVPPIRDDSDTRSSPLADKATIDARIGSILSRRQTSDVELKETHNDSSADYAKGGEAAQHHENNDNDEQKSKTETTCVKNGDERKRALQVTETNPDKELTSDKPPKTTRKQNEDRYINGKVRTVGTDPTFLDSFFSSSRLSFIGSYKQRTATATVTSPSKPDVTYTKSKRLVFHIDMDCFFANVVLRNFPEHREKPVAISHHGLRINSSGDDDPGIPNGSESSKNSTSECATCNYKAREYGIKKGMFLGRARQLCPELVVLYYDFDGYEEVTEQVMEILYRVASEHKGVVEAVSCDEAYMEAYFQDDDGKADTRAGDLAKTIRREIFETTQCTASIGVSTNKFLAKLGTDQVKPNGSFVVQDYRKLLDGLKLRDLHGIGWRSEPKLSSEGLVEVRDVWDLGPHGETALSRILGPGLGKKIFMYCQGEDDRQVKPAERKTIGAECNYGVRFDGPYGVDYMIDGLAKEIQKRMEGVGVRGRRLTLKLKQRKKGAKPPPKFLGHGSCHNLSKSREVPGSSPTRDAAIFSRIGMTLFSELAVPLDDVRGMGMVVSKLDHDHSIDVETAPLNRITSWFKKNSHRKAKSAMTNVATRMIDFEPVSSMQKSVDRDENEVETGCDINPGGLPSTGQREEDELAKKNSREKIDEPADEKLSPRKKDLIADLPPHFQEVMASDEAATNSSSRFEPDIARKTPLQLDRFHLDDGSRMDSNMPIDDENGDQNVALASSPPSTQIELPPLSQLHMSQVQALPPDLRRQIIARLDTECYQNALNKQREVIHIDEQEDPSLAHPTQRGGLADTGMAHTGTKNQPHPPVPPSPELDSAGRFRQTSLTRMIRLAAVKSGHVATTISLSQLDHLPLELKLEVVNDESRPVGALIPPRLQRPSNSRHKEVVPTLPLPTHLDNLTGAELPTDLSWSETHPVSHTTTADLPANEEQDTQEGLEEGEDENVVLVRWPGRDPRAFFRENVAPLRVFLDENPPAYEEAIETVTTFLCQCVTEGQLRDVVILFRSIRNRGDGWSNECILEQLAKALDDRHFNINKSRLDIDWLLGR